MLTQQRHEIILKLLKEKGSITVTEVRDLLDTSESTVRRDITALDKEGKLEKVFGGAVEAGQKVTAHEYTVAQKNELNCDAKRKIAEYAASLIKADDFVYLDAGTTTGLMLEYLEGVKADPQRQPRRASPVLEPEQYRQIRAKCQDQQKLFPPQRLRTAFCQMKTQKIIAQYRYH